MYNSNKPDTRSEEDTVIPSIQTSPNQPLNEQKTPKKEPSFLSEMLRFSLVALLIVVPIRMFIAQPFIVSGASMESTFSTGQYLIVDQVSYRFEEPHRGDVIVFRYPKDPSKYFIKRIIGIPGDSLHIDNNLVTLTNKENPQGVTLSEPYILDDIKNTTLDETLGENEYFVMGDNRNASSDSRMWGVLQRSSIVGRAFLRLFPLNETNIFPGTYDITGTFLNNETE